MMLALPLLLALGAGDVDLTLSPPTQSTPEGCDAYVDVLLSADMPTEIVAVDLILSWDPTELELVQNISGPDDWFVSGFLNDPDGINDDLTDGDALFTALAYPFGTVIVPPASVLVTFHFKALDDGQVSILPSLGVYGTTKVVGTTPGELITGTLSGPVSIVDVDVPSAVTSRVGTPPNPDVYLPPVSGGPVIGEVWTPVVDHTTFFPGALLDIAFITLPVTNIDYGPPTGTLLCDVFSLPPYWFTSPPGVPFAFPIPELCNLVGKGFCTQVVSVDALIVQLTNALDTTIGTF
jgi:hypothetical protein